MSEDFVYALRLFCMESKVDFATVLTRRHELANEKSRETCRLKAMQSRLKLVRLGILGELNYAAGDS